MLKLSFCTRLVRTDGELAEFDKNMRGYDTNEREGTAAKRIEVTTNGWVRFLIISG